MGIIVKKLPAVKLFNELFDECMYFKLDTALIKISDVLNLIYSMLSECTYKKVNDDKVEKFADEVK
eukprot:11757731-Ditylum_brightwellii.AAC.1